MDCKQQVHNATWYSKSNEIVGESCKKKSAWDMSAVKCKYTRAFSYSAPCPGMRPPQQGIEPMNSCSVAKYQSQWATAVDHMVQQRDYVHACTATNSCCLQYKSRVRRCIHHPSPNQFPKVSHKNSARMNVQTGTKNYFALTINYRLYNKQTQIKANQCIPHQHFIQQSSSSDLFTEHCRKATQKLAPQK